MHTVIVILNDLENEYYTSLGTKNATKISRWRKSTLTHKFRFTDLTPTIDKEPKKGQ